MQCTMRLALSFMAILAIGCESDPDRDTDARFGDSVRNAIALQTAPNAKAPGLDATKAGLTLSTYRADVAQPKKVEQPIIFNIGGGSGGGGK